MIRSFKDSDTRRLFVGDRAIRLQAIASRAIERSNFLNSANTLRDLAMLRSNRLKSLRGDRSGQHSIRINDQWRICFRWTDAGPCAVNCGLPLSKEIQT